MSELEILTDQFPNADIKSLSVGDSAILTVRGIVRSIEDELIDITEFGGTPRFISGPRRVYRLMVIGVERQ